MKAIKNSTPAGDHDRFGLSEQLGGDLFSEVGIFFLTRNARGDDTCCQRDQQRGDLGDQAAPDGEQGISLGRLKRGHAVHGHPDDQAPDDVDDGDDDTCDHVPFDELHRAVHRSVELALFGQGQAEFARLVGVDDPAAHIGVDAHLLTGHRIQSKAGSDLSDPLSTFCHDDELHDRDD